MPGPLKPRKYRGIQFHTDGRVTLPFLAGTTRTTTASLREAIRQAKHVMDSASLRNQRDVRLAMQAAQLNRAIIRAGKENKKRGGKERLGEAQKQSLKRRLQWLAADYVGLQRHFKREFAPGAKQPRWLELARPEIAAFLRKSGHSPEEVQAFFKRFKFLVRSPTRHEFVDRIARAFEFIDKGNLPPANLLIVSAAKRTSARRTAETIGIRESKSRVLRTLLDKYNELSHLNRGMTDYLIQLRKDLAETGTYTVRQLPGLVQELRTRAEELRPSPYPEHWKLARSRLLAAAKLLEEATKNRGRDEAAYGDRAKKKSAAIKQIRAAVGSFINNQRKLDFNKPD